MKTTVTGPLCRRPYLPALTFFMLSTLLGCVMMGPSQQTSSGGTGSEIVGTAAHDTTGAPAGVFHRQSAASRLLPVIAGNVFCYQSAFVPDTNWARSPALPRARTDTAGFFSIKDAPPGLVMVEVNDGLGNAAIDTVSILKDSTRYELGALVINKTGAISIQAQTNLSGRVRFYVGVKGTHLVVRGSQTGVAVRLDNIPCGMPQTVCIRVYEPIPFSMDIPNITVSQAATTILETFQIQ